MRYRKMKDLEFQFTDGINVISGTNGTCKTSLLHIISNSFQAVTKTCDWIQDPNCIYIINKVNSILNPKIERLTKGDKKFNDPANGHKGTLLKVEYYNYSTLDFRKHISPKNNRYSIKPYYGKGNQDSLPYCPIIYLGLSRLFPFGEFQNEETVKSINNSLPKEYQDEISKIYEDFTHLKVFSSAPQQMGDIKVRSDFSSEKEGVDSNTISDGEDNLFILLTALISLKYYFNSITSKNYIESILLIDELDGTLHPSFQYKILNLFRKFAQEFKIQIIFTTHSLSILEYALQKKDNVIYLIDNVTTVKRIEAPDIYKIKMYLHNITDNDIYSGKKIPIFSEDAEARVFLNILFDFFTENYEGFSKVRNYFHIVNVNIGAKNILNIFEDIYLLKSTMQSICILDGDQHNKRDLNKHITVLPGIFSPEKLIMNYSVTLFEADDPFWIEPSILSCGYGKIYYLDKIKPDFDSIDIKIQELKKNGISIHGKERELRKKIFEKHERFFELLFRHWINNPNNRNLIDPFYNDLHILFKKVAAFHGVNPKFWDFD